jgi:hypothetical protein
MANNLRSNDIFPGNRFFIISLTVLQSKSQAFFLWRIRYMPRRKRINKQQPKKKMNWTTTVWYIIGALIVIAMVFSLVAGAFR